MNDIGYQIFKNMFFRYFSTCSNWTNFHNELVFLNDIFLKNVYPISFIDKCFKTVFDRLYLKRPQVLTAKNNTLTLVLPFLRKFSLQTRTKLQKVLKRTLSCSQIQIVFRKKVYTHFESLLPTTYTFSISHSVVFRCFSICSNWTNFHNELVFLKNIFLKNVYPISFVHKSFKAFSDRLYLKRPESFNC